MPRGLTIAERAALIDQREEELAARTETLVHNQPTAVHIQTVKVLRDLLTLGRKFSGPNVPAPLRMLMRTLDKMEPVLIEELADVDPDELKAFLLELRNRLDSVLTIE